MSTIEEIEKAIEALPKSDLLRLWDRFQSRVDDAWDEQIEADSASGRLDSFIDQARSDHRAGRTLPFPSDAESDHT